MPIFSHNEQLWIFRPKFGKMAQLHAIFWFNNVEDVTDSWAEIDGAGRRWVDLTGGRWSWVEVGARFCNTPCHLACENESSG